MPDWWSDKEERMYQHIKENYLDDGVATDEAKERAARTVNKYHGKNHKGPHKKSSWEPVEEISHTAQTMDNMSMEEPTLPPEANYRPAEDQMRSCASCLHFQSGYCAMFDAPVMEEYTCDFQEAMEDNVGIQPLSKSASYLDTFRQMQSDKAGQMHDVMQGEFLKEEQSPEDAAAQWGHMKGFEEIRDRLKPEDAWKGVGDYLKEGAKGEIVGKEETFGRPVYLVKWANGLITEEEGNAIQRRKL